MGSCWIGPQVHAGRATRHQLQRQRDAEFAQKLRQVDIDYDSRHHLDTGGKIDLNESFHRQRKQMARSLLPSGIS